MTAFATISTAVQAIRQGAFDYVQKPFESEEILIVVDRAIEHQKLVSENAAFRANADAMPPKVLVGEICRLMAGVIGAAGSSRCRRVLSQRDGADFGGERDGEGECGAGDSLRRVRAGVNGG